MRNLIRRINRKLAKEGEKLLTSRSWMEKQNLGDYHIINDRNVVIAWNVDPDKLAAELGFTDVDVETPTLNTDCFCSTFLYN